jgi:fructokinase
MSKTLLYPLVRQQVVDLLNNYVRTPVIVRAIDDYIVPPWLGEHAGVLGALAQRMLAGMRGAARGACSDHAS